MSWLSRQKYFQQNLSNGIPYFWDANSTTKRARTIDPNGFKVHLKTSAFQTAYSEEYHRLNINLQQVVWVREVELTLLTVPVMFARLIVPYQSLDSAFQRIRYLGSEPLGRYLFQFQGITRTSFEARSLKKGDWIFEKALESSYSPSLLWARRSVFQYAEAKMLLTEVFLPQYEQIFGK